MQGHPAPKRVHVALQGGVRNQRRGAQQHGRILPADLDFLRLADFGRCLADVLCLPLLLQLGQNKVADLEQPLPGGLLLFAGALAAQQRLDPAPPGQVQGVGFRPYVYRLALELGLTGWVRNDPSGVTLEVPPPEIPFHLEPDPTIEIHVVYEDDDLLPHRESAWILLEERVRDASAFCATIVSARTRTAQVVDPISTASPGLSGVEPWSWVPLTKVPFFDLRSVNTTWEALSSMRAW